MTKVTVLHNVSRDAGFGLNQVFTREGKAHAPRSHELVPVFEFDTAELLTPGSENIMPTNGEIVADIIFRAFNVGDDLAFTAATSPEYTVACKYRARWLRSLSVGDVLSFDGKVFLACGRFDWTRVPEDELLVLDVQAAERVIRARYEMSATEPLTATVPLEG